LNEFGLKTNSAAITDSAVIGKEKECSPVYTLYSIQGFGKHKKSQ